MKRIFLYTIMFLFLAGTTLSCGSHKKAVSSKPPKAGDKTHTRQYGSHDERTLAYIKRYKDIAKKEMKEYKIPASITLAQGILESKSGESRLAREANNHFGIKCGDDWEGKKVLHDDDHKNECFRVYANAEESFRDHSKFLAGKRRYAFLFRFPLTDYEAWAKGLRQAGYATDRSYPQKLIYLIEKYHLDKYDKEVLSEMKIRTPEEEENAGGQKEKGEKIIYEVKSGETLFSISRKFGIPVREIKELNNLVDFDIYEGQILVLKVPEEKANQEEVAEEAVDEKAQEAREKAQAAKEEAVESVEAKEASVSKAVNDSVQRTPDKQAVEAISQISGHHEEEEETPEEPVVSSERLHVVQQGETLYSIARQYGITVEDLVKANHLTDQHLSVGQKLIIPDNTDKPVVTSTEKASPELPAYHVVQPGETLYRIHVKYGIPVETLRRLNGLKNNTIKVGQKLKLR